MDLRSLVFSIDFRNIDSSPVKDANKAMDGVKESMSRIVKEADKVGTGIKESMKTSPVDKMKSTTDKLKDTMKKVTDESSVLGKTLNLLRQTAAIRFLSNGLDRVSSLVVKTKDKFMGMSNAIDKIKTSRIGEKLSPGIERLGNVVDKVRQKASSMGERLSSGMDKFKGSINNVAKELEKLNPKMEKLGKSLMTKVTAPVIGFATAGTKMFLDLDNNIRKVTTLADANVLPVDKIRSEVRAISDASGTAQAEIADATYSALSAGVDSADVMKFVRSGIDLTMAGFTDMDTVIDATTTVLNAYGDAAYDVGKIHDIFVQTQDKGKISVDELGKNIGRVIPTASSLGVNLDQLGASYAILTAKGQNANIATTNLNAMFNELGTTGSKTDKALRSVAGKSFAELTAEGKNTGEILGMLKDHAESSGLTLKDMFGSTSAGAAALTLLSEGVDGFNKSLDNMNNSGGKTAENAKTMEDGWLKIQTAMTKVKNTLIDVGAIIAPYVGMIADKVSELMEKFNGLSGKTKGIVGIITLVAAAIGPLIFGFSKFSGFLLNIPKHIETIGLAFELLTGSIGLPLVAIVGLVATLVHLWKTNETFRDVVIGIWESIKTTLGNALEYIKGLWETHGESIKTTVMNVFDIIKNVILIALTVILGVIIVVLGIIKALWAGFGETIIGIISGAWSFIQGIIKGAMLIIQGIIDVALGIVEGNWDRVFNGLASILEGAVGIIKSLWQGAIDLLTTPIDAVVNLLDTVFKNKLEGVKKAWNGLKEFLKNPISGVVNLFRRDSGGKVDGSHASGAYNIPFDGYLGELHKGEMVLTKSASDIYRAMGGTENSVPITNNYSTSTTTTTVRNGNESKNGGNSVVFSPTYHIELSGIATEADKQEIEKVIDKKTRELFNQFFKEMNMKMA